MATIEQELQKPFQESEIGWKPRTVTQDGQRAFAVAYLDAKTIQQRLDNVLGAGGWSDEYEVLPTGSVVCKLTLKVGDVWVTRSDVGSPSKQPDAGDKLKAAFSDSFKRAACKFGVGRYLSKFKGVWADYDNQKKQFRERPKMGATAPVPVPQKPAVAPAPAPKKQETITKEQGEILAKEIQSKGMPWDVFAKQYAIQRLGELPSMHFDHARIFVHKYQPPVNQDADPVRPSVVGIRTGEDLLAYATKMDDWLQSVRPKIYKAGELIDYLDAVAKKAGFLSDAKDWDQATIERGIQSINKFVAQMEQSKAA